MNFSWDLSPQCVDGYLLAMSSHGLFSVHTLLVFLSRLIRTLILLDQSPILMNSFNLDYYLLKGPPPLQTHRDSWSIYKLLLFSFSVTPDSLSPQGLQHTRPPHPLPSPGVCSDSCRLSWWCHPTIASCVVPSFCLQSFPASGSFWMSWLFASDGQSFRASASVFPKNVQGWFPLGLTNFISFLSKGLSRVLQHHNSKTSILQHSAFFMVQLSHLYSQYLSGGRGAKFTP